MPLFWLKLHEDNISENCYACWNSLLFLQQMKTMLAYFLMWFNYFILHSPLACNNATGRSNVRDMRQLLDQYTLFGKVALALPLEDVLNFNLKYTINPCVVVPKPEEKRKVLLKILVELSILLVHFVGGMNPDRSKCFITHTMQKPI